MEKDGRLGNIISIGYFVRHYLDMGKVTGNQGKESFKNLVPQKEEK